MNLKEVRGYYGGMSKTATFMSLVLIIVLSGISIYIADIIAGSTDEGSSTVYCLYTVFVTGVVMIILDIIALCMGRKQEFEAAFKFRKFLSGVGLIISAIAIYAASCIITGTYKEWDGDAYTIVIFAILFVTAVLMAVYNVVGFYVAFTGAKYYDGKKVAKDVKESVNEETCKRNKTFFTAITYSLLASSSALMFLYFSKQIEEYERIRIKDCGMYKEIYFLLFVALITGCAVLLIGNIVNLFIKKEAGYKFTKIMYLVNTFIQIVYIAVAVISINADFVKAAYPDMAYIIFTGILIIFTESFVLPELKKKK